MKFDFSKLRGRIVEKYGSQTSFAEAIGISENTLSLKLTNRVKMSAQDIYRYAELLDIDAGDIGIYFFTLAVQRD